MENRRREFLESLVSFKVDRKSLENSYDTYSPDYQGNPMSVSDGAIKSVLVRFSNQEIENDDLVWWANAIEGREDLEESAAARDVIHKLANPELEGPPSASDITEMISQLC